MFSWWKLKSNIFPEKKYMKNSNRKQKYESSERNMVFNADCMADVTNFDAESPEDDFGYVCSVKAVVYSDGIMVLQEADGKILEHFDIKTRVLFHDAVNNFSPSCKNAVRLILDDKAVMLTFREQESKMRFLNCMEGGVNEDRGVFRSEV